MLDMLKIKNRKKYFIISLVVLILLSPISYFFITFEENRSEFEKQLFWNGDGTKENPYQIEDVNDLQNMEEYLNAHYEIITDIDASETEEWNEGDGFDPIGGEENEFNGSLEGKNHEIKNLHINRSEEHDVGLFGVIGDEGVVKNVSISDAEVVGDQFVGSLTGGNRGWVINSVVAGNITGNNYVGGLVGAMIGDNGQTEAGTVQNSSAHVNVAGYQNNTGGLVGQNRGIVIESYADGYVYGSSRVGGLVGSNYWGSQLKTSYATSEVNGEEYVGGLVGFLGSHLLPGAEISNSYSMGDVYGEVKVGGLVGHSNPYGEINKSYSTGEVNGEEDVGGLIGDSDIPANIKNSFWNVETSQTNISNGGTGKATEEMKDVATYTDTDTDGLEDPWDFVGNPNDDEGDDQIWNIDDQQEVNYGYPFLNWQDIELTYDLTIDSTEGGEVIEPGEGIFTYDHGDSLNLIAEPFEDYKFVEWSGDVENLEDAGSEETTITVYNDYHITANFEEIEDEKHILNIGVEGKGTTEPEPGEHEYEHEEEVKIEAIPEENWSFGEWSGDNQTIEDTKSNETTIEMLDNYTITAQFSVNIYNLNIESTEGGEVEKPGEGTFQYEHGEEVNLTAVPDEGWFFKEWTGDHAGTEEQITITMDEDKEIMAVFEDYEEYATLKIEDITGEGTVLVDGEVIETPFEKNYEQGEEAELSADPDEGWFFKEWESIAEEDADITITMDEDKEITAHFEEERDRDWSSWIIIIGIITMIILAIIGYAVKKSSEENDSRRVEEIYKSSLPVLKKKKNDDDEKNLDDENHKDDKENKQEEK